MKNPIPRLLATAFAVLPAALQAQVTAGTATPAPAWHTQSLIQSLVSMVLFGLVGTALAIIGYKLFDRCTPGDLNREIVEHRNIAAAIVAAAVILGVCLIIVAAMLG